MSNCCDRLSYGLERWLILSFLVFHGGSGSTKEEIREAVVNGVVKMNVDTDTQVCDSLRPTKHG